VEVQLHAFLTSVLEGGEWSTSHLGHFTPWGKSSEYPLDRRLVGPQSWSGHSGKDKKIPFLAPARN